MTWYVVVPIMAPFVALIVAMARDAPMTDFRKRDLFVGITVTIVGLTLAWLAIRLVVVLL